jgi:hypothetical protein
MLANFYWQGIAWLGAGSSGRQPTTYATGNQLYNSVIKDCTDQHDGSDGAIRVAGQEGILIHHNNFTQTGRPQGHNGNIMWSGFYNRGMKLYNNKFYKVDWDGPVYNNGINYNGWNFIIEHWNCEADVGCTVPSGGIEIYNNEFYGSDCAIDIGGHYNSKGSYPYTWYIHHNLFTTLSQTAKTDSGGGVNIITIEGYYNSDMWMYYNRFVHIPTVLGVEQQYGGHTGNIYFGYNIIEKAGWSYEKSWSDYIIKIGADAQRHSIYAGAQNRHE